MTRAQLPNSPLTQVACEVRFRGDLMLYEVWGRFQREVRREFPKLFVPTATPGISPMTQSMKLDSADGAKSILLAINSFGLSTERYVQFSSFRSEFLSLQALFCDLLGLSELTRFGLRYVNFLPPAGDNGSFGDLVHPGLTLELKGISGESWSSQPQLLVEKTAGRCVLRTAVFMAQNQAPFAPGLQQQPNSGFPGLMPGVQLDFDCYRSSTYAVSELPALLDEAHDIIDKAFFGMITEEYLAYLKGSPQCSPPLPIAKQP